MLFLILGSLLVLMASALIPVVREYATIPLGSWIVTVFVTIVLINRWQASEQSRAAVLAYQHLGLHPPTPSIPAVLLRHGAQFLDAWLFTHGVANPATGLVPRAGGAMTTPYVDSLKGLARLGPVLMFVGLGILLLWGGILIFDSVSQSAPGRVLGFVLAAAVLAFVAGFVVTVLVAQVRVRRRTAWASAHGRTSR